MRSRRPLVVCPCERLETRLALAAGAAANPPLPAYDIGSPTLTEIWVDPTLGHDGRRGASRAEAVRTLSEAWRQVPVGVALSQGVRINLVAGAYPESVVPNYWENRFGTRAAPIIVRAADGPGTARRPTVNVFGCRHLVFEGLDISAGGGDVLHFEACTHVLLRNTAVRGTGTIATYAVPQEALKMNQCQYVNIENRDISGAWDNAIDFVAVQYGHVVGSRIHRAGDWAMHAKGGVGVAHDHGQPVLRCRHGRLHRRAGDRLRFHDGAVAAVRGLRHHLHPQCDPRHAGRRHRRQRRHRHLDGRQHDVPRGEPQPRDRGRVRLALLRRRCGAMHDVSRPGRLGAERARPRRADPESQRRDPRQHRAQPRRLREPVAALRRGHAADALGRVDRPGPTTDCRSSAT